jgi:polyphosphate glucokinase
MRFAQGRAAAALSILRDFGDHTRMRTLSIDIGGTGIKAIVLDLAGVAITERARIETPRPATPDAVLGVIEQLAKTQGEFDRVSVGFPGVIRETVTKTAPNLDPSWAGFDLGKAIEHRLHKPVRVANDAVIQGLGVIEGKGLEVVITLGTGLGCGVYIDGKQAGLELAHHPLRKGKTYEELVGNAARKKAGNARWNKRVRRVIQQIGDTFNFRRLYIGGGNVKHLVKEGLSDDVVVVDNMAGLLGGIRLWG